MVQDSLLWKNQDCENIKLSYAFFSCEHGLLLVMNMLGYFDLREKQEQGFNF